MVNDLSNYRIGFFHHIIMNNQIPNLLSQWHIILVFYLTRNIKIDC